MPVTHFADLIVQVSSYAQQWVERAKAVGQELNQGVGKWLFPFCHFRESVPLVLLLGVAQSLIPTLLIATARAEGGPSPHHGSGSAKSAQSAWVESGQKFRSQPQRAVLISRLEPEASSGTSPESPKITSRALPGQVIEPLISSRSYDFRGENLPVNPDPVTAWKGNPSRYSLLSWQPGNSVGRSGIEKVNRRDATFGSSAMTITDGRTPGDGLETQFRPLIEIHVGAYKLPIFLDAPNPQADWPRW
jgi:hypothetical protein